MAQPSSDMRPKVVGQLLLHNLYHHVHGNFGMDFAAPIGRLIIDHWAQQHKALSVASICDYHQELDIFDGVLETHIACNDGHEFEQEQFFSQMHKNLFSARIRNTGSKSHKVTLRFEPILAYDLDFEQTLRAEATLQCTDESLRWRVDTGSVTTWLEFWMQVSPNASVRQLEQSFATVIEPGGECTIWMIVMSDLEVTNPIEKIQEIFDFVFEQGFDAVSQAHKSWWTDFWSESLLALPECALDLQKIWLRGNYYLGQNFLDSKIPHPPPAFGFAATATPSFSPEGVLLSYQNLLTANHLRHASFNAAFWFDISPNAQNYCQQILRRTGAAYPWIPPLFDWSDYHLGGVPNKLFYQHHTQALVGRLIHDYSRFSGEQGFLAERAYPIIRELAQFYRSILSVDLRSEQYEIRFTPSQSQDEYAPPHQNNYFDCLLAAQYTIQTAYDCAVALQQDEQLCQQWLQILAAGFAYAKLSHGDHYSVYEGDPRQATDQQSPVQLNPVYLLSVPDLADAPQILSSYHRRYQICSLHQSGTTAFSCLGSFLLSSCRLRNIPGFLLDFDQIKQHGVFDPDFIQTFQGSEERPYFMPTQGLVMEAITECFVQWWKGVLEFFPNILPDWISSSENEPIIFRSFRTPGAFLISGVLQGNQEYVKIECEKGGQLRFRIPARWRQGTLFDTSRSYLCTVPGEQIITTDTLPGEVFHLYRTSPCTHSTGFPNDIANN